MLPPTPMQPMSGSASSTDILTALKAIATNILSATQAYQAAQGTKQVAGLTASTVVSTGQGRLVNIIVTDPGAAEGQVLDGTKVVFTIPKVHDVYTINIPVNSGITVNPGAGQVVTVSYS